MGLKKYRSHKVVEAAKIKKIVKLANDADLLVFEDEAGRGVSPAYMDKHSPKAGGYYVRCEDGYESWSPAEAFEAGYALVPEDGINFRDVAVLTHCLGCWKPLGSPGDGTAAMIGESWKCCGRTYDGCYSIRSGPDAFNTGFRLTHDEQGPVPSGG